MTSLNIDDQAAAERRQPWWKGQLSLPNIIAVGVLVISLVTWQNAKDWTDKRQDDDIRTIKEQAKEDRAVYARQDLLREQLTTITDQLKKLDTKVDNIGRAVR